MDTSTKLPADAIEPADLSCITLITISYNLTSPINLTFVRQCAVVLNLVRADDCFFFTWKGTTTHKFLVVSRPGRPPVLLDEHDSMAARIYVYIAEFSKVSFKVVIQPATRGDLVLGLQQTEWIDGAPIFAGCPPPVPNSNEINLYERCLSRCGSYRAYYKTITVLEGKEYRLNVSSHQMEGVTSSLDEALDSAPEYLTSELEAIKTFEIESNRRASGRPRTPAPSFAPDDVSPPNASPLRKRVKVEERDYSIGSEELNALLQDGFRSESASIPSPQHLPSTSEHEFSSRPPSVDRQASSARDVISASNLDLISDTSPSNQLSGRHESKEHLVGTTQEETEAGASSARKKSVSIMSDGSLFGDRGGSDDDDEHQT